MRLRSFAGVSIPLPQAKALAKRSGGKLNDVVLALSSGVVRRYLLSQNALPNKSLTAGVPISLREEGNADSNNQVFGMICSLATDIADPKARLEAIIAQSSKSKEMSHPLRALMPQISNISMLGAPIMVQILALLYSRSNLSDVLPPAVNITVSNVPGPRQTLYAVGAELLHIFPVSIAAHGVALNITVQSYRDLLDFGFIAGANVIPHVQVLADMLPEELAALEAAYASAPDAPPRSTAQAPTDGGRPCRAPGNCPAPDDTPRCSAVRPSPDYAAARAAPRPTRRRRCCRVWRCPPGNRRDTASRLLRAARYIRRSVREYRGHACDTHQATL